MLGLCGLDCELVGSSSILAEVDSIRGKCSGCSQWKSSRKKAQLPPVAPNATSC